MCHKAKSLVFYLTGDSSNLQLLLLAVRFDPEISHFLKVKNTCLTQCAIKPHKSTDEWHLGYIRNPTVQAEGINVTER